MTLVPVDPKNIPMNSTRHAYCKVMKIIDGFMNSEHKIVQLKFDPGEYTSVSSVQSTFRKAIGRMHVNCKVTSRLGKVYLIKGEVDNG